MNDNPAPLRVIIHAMGSSGDVHPFIGIGLALRRRGHEVFVATNPVFREAVEASGLGFRALGTVEDFHRIKSHPDLWHPRRAFPLIIREAVDPSHGLILDITRELQLPGKTVLLAGSLAFGARTARDLLGIPLATVHLAPSLFPSVFRQPAIHGMPFGNRAPRFLKRLQWRIADQVIDHHALPVLNSFRRSHGLDAASRLFSDWWHSPDRVIALFPEWFAPAQPDWPTQTLQTGFPLFDEPNLHPVPQELGAFLGGGDPPVIFTPGSAMSQSRAFFREATAALRKTGLRGLFLTPFRECLPEKLPAQIAHFSYIPFSRVLPRAAALVHHGGIGTCAQALQAGIPQLIQPMAHDQLDTLSRVHDLGVGLGLPPAKFRENRIATALQSLLSEPSYGQRAKETAAEFQPELWMRQTCECIESLAN